MEIFLKLLSFFAAAAVLVVLIRGLWTMLKGDSPSTSQRLMRLRIILQGIAIVVLMGLLWFSGRGP